MYILLFTIRLFLILLNHNNWHDLHSNHFQILKDLMENKKKLIFRYSLKRQNKFYINL